MSYGTGKAPSLGVPASTQGDFSMLIDSGQRSALTSAKTFFSVQEMDHLLKSIFKAFEVLSFLDWCLGAVAKKLQEFPSLRAEATDLENFLSCADRAVRDGSHEVAALYAMGVLEKHELWVSFTAKGVSTTEIGCTVFPSG